MPHRAVLLVIATTLIVACDHTPADLPPPPPSGLVPPENHVPVASITAPATAEEGIGITFDGRGSADADKDSLTFAWDLGDGSQVPGSLITHGFAAAGSYTVRLIVRDPRAAADTASVIVRITAPAPAPGGYDVIDLGTLGGNAAMPIALNDSGQVVGVSLTVSGQRHAFLWEAGTMRDLAPDLPSSTADVIANSGAIGGVDYSLSYAPRLLLWRDGTRTNLPLIYVPGEGRVAHLVGVSEAGDVVAWLGSDRYRSAVWHDGVPDELGTLAGPSTEVMATNPNGAMVGSSMIGEFKGDEIRHAFLWNNGTMRDLGLLGDYFCDGPTPPRSCGHSRATAINANGQVLGASSTAAGYEEHIVVWRDDQIWDLGIGQPVGLNAAGDVVGNVGPSAAIWRGGNGTPEFIGSLGGDSTVAVALSNAGTIAGSSFTAA
ncbi:MAG TPA: PKD domain-containing protein, partial [Gemmatimonadales bacterium]|nr:PKD domain-containing protein [Gemmatimonadales bacterium]